MKIVKFILLVLVGAAVLHGCLAVFAAHCAHAGTDPEGWQPIAAAPELGLEAKLAAWSLAIYAIARTVLEVLKAIAPLTRTPVDDQVRDALLRVLGDARPPPPQRDPQAGIARTLLLVVLSGLVIGGAVGAGAVGCAATEKYTDAAGHALYRCGKNDLPSIIATAAGLGARAALARDIDEDALYTAAKGAGLGIGTCAAAEFWRALSKQPEAQVAARGGEPGPAVRAQAVLERLRAELGGVRLELADGTVL